MATTNSQKKSPNKSTPSERSKPKKMPRSQDNNLNHDHEQENSVDLVARIRAAREAAELEMHKFGKVSEYEVRKVYGQRSDLNYDDDSVPGLPDHQGQERGHERSELPLEREQSSEGDGAPEADRKQRAFDFGSQDARQPSPDEEG